MGRFSHLGQRLKGLLGGRRLSEGDAEALEEIFYEADFGWELSESLLERAASMEGDFETLKGSIGELLRGELEGSEVPDKELASKPYVICLVGVNGAGKTTTVAKLGHWFSEKGHRVLVASCDTFRAGANAQLKHWCEDLGVDLVESQRGGDAASVAFDAWKAALARSADVLLLDTAGRLHNKGDLMREVEKLCRVLKREDERLPHEVWLVLDGSLGMHSLAQALAFHECLGLTGLVMTKLDGSSRAGALVPIYKKLGVPVCFVGLGEQCGDLRRFEVGRYVEGLLDA